MGRYCDSCHGLLDGEGPVVTATRQSAHRRAAAHSTTTTVRSYQFHERCWERVSGFGGYQRATTRSSVA